MRAIKSLGNYKYYTSVFFGNYCYKPLAMDTVSKGYTLLGLIAILNNFCSWLIFPNIANSNGGVENFWGGTSLWLREVSHW